MTETKNKTLGSERNKILLAGVIIQFCAGVIYMWSIFKGPVSDYLEWDSALTGSIMLVAFVLGMLGGGRIMDKYGPKIICISGSLLMSAGIICASFVTSSIPDMLYVTYGIMGGFGVGMVYTATVSSVQRWFYDKRGFATGMMVSAFGFSLVFFSPLVNYLLDNMGVPSTFQILGIAFLVICTVMAFFIVYPPEDYAVAGSPDKKSVKASQKQYTTKEMLGTKSFYLITLSLFFVLSAYFVLNPQFKSLGIERGLSESIAVMGVMITGVCSALGRLSLTWVSDRIGRTQALIAVAILSVIGVTLIVFAENYLFVACLAIIAFAFGGAAGVYTPVVSDHFGTENMGTNYGIIMLGFGASALVFPLISKSTSTETSFIMCAIACLIALVCMLLLRTQKSDQPDATV